MIVELLSIGDTAKPIDVKIAAYEIDLGDDNLRLTDDARFRGEMQRVAGKAHIRGMLTADVETTCTRCLEPLTRHIEAAFDDVFVDAGEETTSAESEVDESELDEQLVIGGRVDMADIVREQILLAVPDQIFCREDCRGLCPKCGENLNLIDCKCADDDIDPRWAALKNLN